MRNKRFCCSVFLFALYALYLCPSTAYSLLVARPEDEYCGNLKKLRGYVDSCEKNVVLSTIGLKCIVRFYKDSISTAEALKGVLAGGKEKQKENFSDNK